MRRTTFVPLNVAKSRPIPPDKVAAAKKATSGRAAPALDLVQYDADVKVAVQYAYGTAFICEDAEVAKIVCYSRNISTRGISLQVWASSFHACVFGGHLALFRSCVQLGMYMWTLTCCVNHWLHACRVMTTSQVAPSLEGRAGRSAPRLPRLRSLAKLTRICTG